MDRQLKITTSWRRVCLGLGIGLLLGFSMLVMTAPSFSYAADASTQPTSEEMNVISAQAVQQPDEAALSSNSSSLSADNQQKAQAVAASNAANATAVEAEESGSENLQAAASNGNGPSVSYQTHVQNIGWQASVSNGAMSGTEGQSLRLEGLKVTLSGGDYTGSIEYTTQIQDIGWEQGDWKSNGEMSGTEGRSLRLETLRIRLTGDIANYYHVYYRVHCQDLGWMGWAYDGGDAGSVGISKRLEGLEIKLYKKGSVVPSATTSASYEPYIGYTAHVQNVGWQAEVYDGAEAGTDGQALRVEALKVRLVEMNAGYLGGVTYNAHVQDYGWMAETSNDGVVGTTGEAKRIEALKINLTGDIANHYDIYYHVHVQNIGWMGWAKNGEAAGTSARALRVEALEIRLVTKGGAAPGSTDNAFLEGSSIMGASQTNVDQMVRYYNSKGKTYPSGTLGSKGAGDIRTFSQILLEESNAEGVRAEVVFCQAMLESAWLEFGGAVQAYQCNFAGMGAIDSDPVNNSYTYADVRTGLRAQIQHLKAYASSEALANPVVSASNAYNSYIADGSRYYVVGDVYGFGCAPTLEDLSEKWASGSTYGQDIERLVNELLAA